MIGRASCLLVVGLAACSAGVAPSRTPAEPAPADAPRAAVRLIHSPGDPDFWVLRTAGRSLVVASGARLEIAASGEIAEVAWDLDLARRGDPLAGALAVPDRLGGGFVHWSSSRVFRSRTFTGPLEPVAMDAPSTIRGARAGAPAVLVFTDAGPRELPPGAMRLGASAEPGLLDAAALADGRAVRIDLFGRAIATDDGKRSVDLTPSLGLGARHVVMGEDDLWIETLHDRAPILAGGKVGEPVGRPVHDPSKRFQIVWKEPAIQGDPSWASGPLGPLAAAVAAGGDAGDGTAFGVVQGTPVRVDLRMGRAIAIAGEWSPNGLVCQPVRARDALLFACTWERYQGYGGYVLRSVEGAPPVIERAFSDDGMYASDDEGALGYLGSCRTEARFFDPDEPSRSADGAGETPLSPVMCVRRGPGDWVERRVEIGDDATLIAWVPGEGGRAAAIVATSDPLPQPASPAGRATERAGVRVVEIDRDLGGWAIPRMGTQGDSGGGSIDRRFHLGDDGSIDLWLSPAQDASPPVVIGATIDPRGAITVHTAAPGMIASTGAGRFGVAVSTEGDLYETLDRGRTFRLAGRSPVPAGALSAASCSALGCVLGPVVRLGWGDGAPVPRVFGGALLDPPARRPSTKLACRPSGAPALLDPSPQMPAGAHVGVSTGWGDTLDVIRDASVPKPAVDPRPPASKPRTRASAPTPAVTRTQTLVLRPPFTVRGAPRRLNATDASFQAQRRSPVIPLLGPRGDVALLVGADRREILVSGDRITPLAAHERRSYLGGDNLSPAGLVTREGHALVLAHHRRRLAIDELGAGLGSAPALVGVELDPQRKRPITLGRRDDGAVAVLVLDGPAPETAGAAVIDRAAATAGPVAKLAPWSSLTAADDPACRTTAEKGAFRALFVIEPTAFFTLDEASLPGFAFGHQGLILVRWGRDRVCLEAIDASLVDHRTRGAAARSFRLVARWAGEGDRGAALRAPDLEQALACRVER